MEKQNRKKGFTLVELIVVIVIIAILAAITVPSLVGYIDRGKETQAIAEARTFLNGLQSIVLEANPKCGNDPVFGTISTSSKVRIGPWTGNEGTAVNTGKTYIQAVNELTGEDFKESNFFNSPNDKKITFSARYTGGTILSFNYISDSKIEIKYTQKNGFQRVK